MAHTGILYPSKYDFLLLSPTPATKTNNLEALSILVVSGYFMVSEPSIITIHCPHPTKGKAGCKRVRMKVAEHEIASCHDR